MNNNALKQSADIGIKRVDTKQTRFAEGCPPQPQQQEYVREETDSGRVFRPLYRRLSIAPPPRHAVSAHLESEHLPQSANSSVLRSCVRPDTPHRPRCFEEVLPSGTIISDRRLPGPSAIRHLSSPSYTRNDRVASLRPSSGRTWTSSNGTVIRDSRRASYNNTLNRSQEAKLGALLCNLVVGVSLSDVSVGGILFNYQAARSRAVASSLMVLSQTQTIFTEFGKVHDCVFVALGAKNAYQDAVAVLVVYEDADSAIQAAKQME